MPDTFSSATASGWPHKGGPSADAPARLGPVDADDRALAALLRLGVALDRAAERDAADLAQALCDPGTAFRVRAALAQAGAARRLRLLEWLGEARLPEGRVMVAAVDDGLDGTFWRTELTELERRAILARAALSACRVSRLAR